MDRSRFYNSRGNIYHSSPSKYRSQGEEMSQLQIQFKDDSKKYLADCKRLAEDISRRRGFVAQSDINKIIPRPAGVHPNTVGSIFRGNKKFKMIGARKSETGTRREGIERVWTLTNE